MLLAMLALLSVVEPRLEWPLPCPREQPSAWQGEVVCEHQAGRCVIGFRLRAEQRVTVQCILPESLPDLGSVDDLRFDYDLEGPVATLGVQAGGVPEAAAMIELLTLERRRPRDSVRLPLGGGSRSTRTIAFAAEAFGDARVWLREPRLTRAAIGIGSVTADPSGDALRCELRNRSGVRVPVVLRADTAAREVLLEPYATLEVTLAGLSPPARFEPRPVAVTLHAADGELIDCARSELLLPMDVPHQPLLVRPQSLAALKDRMLDSDREHLLALCAQAMATPLDVPREGGAWEHRYVCQLDGVTLETLSAHEHICPSCGTRYHGPPYDQVVIARQHKDLADQCRNLALAFRVTGDAAYGARAARILSAYAARYPGYPEHDLNGNASRWAGRALAQTLDESAWLIHLCQGLDLLRGTSTLTDEDARAIERFLLRPAIAVIAKNDLGIHNIQCWHDAALFLAGLEADDQRTAYAALHGASGLIAQLENGVLQDGLWYEQSLAYHFYVLAACWPVVHAALALSIDVPLPPLRRMMLAPLDLLQPDLTLPALNDGNGFGLSWVQDQYQQAHARFGDARLAVAAADEPRPKPFESLLYGGELPRPSTALRARSAVLPASGLAMLQSAGDLRSATSVLVDFGPHGGNHGHLDKLGITCFLHGVLAFPEAGSISYGAPLQETWYRRTPAHNTMIVDGMSQQPAVGELLWFDVQDQGSTVAVRCQNAYPGFALLRTVHVTAGGNVVDLFAVHPEPGTRGQHTFDWLLRGAGVLEVDGAPTALATIPGGSDAYASLAAVRGLACGPSVRAVFRAPQLAAHVLLSTSGAPQVFTAHAPGQPAATLHDLLLVRQIGEQARVAALYLGTAPGAGAPAAQLAWVSPERVEARIGSEVIDVVLRR
ncbi:MAG: heparinase II/III family protein [Planctomycetota bacterium]